MLGEDKPLHYHITIYSITLGSSRMGLDIY